MVAYHTDIIADEVAHVSHFMAFVLRDVVEIIGGGLSLQHVAPVDEEAPAGMSLDLLSHEGVDPLQAALAPALMTEVVWKVIPVDVRGEYYS